MKNKKHKRITIQGIEYPTIRDAVKAVSLVSESVVYRNISKGWSPEEALGLIERKHKKSINQVAHEIDNAAFPSTAAMCRYFNVTVSTYECRVRRGYTKKQALSIEPKPKLKSNNKKTDVNGVKFDSLISVATQYNLPLRLVYDRFEKGLRDDDLIAPIKDTKIEVNGTVYDTKVMAARAFGINESTFYNRLNMGWSIEQALLIEPVVSNEDPIESYIYLITNIKNGMKYVGQTRQLVSERWASHVDKSKGGDCSSGSLQKAISEFGVGSFQIETIEILNHHSKLNERERYWIKLHNSHNPHGYNLTTGSFSYSGPRNAPFIVDGKKYQSINSAAKELNIPSGTIRRRIADGWGNKKSVSNTNHSIKPFEYNGKQFASHTDAEIALGIKRGQLSNRLKKNYTKAQAVGDEPVPKRPRGKSHHSAISTIYNNITFDSHTQIDEYLGRSIGYTSTQLARGRTLEQLFKASGK